MSFDNMNNKPLLIVASYDIIRLIVMQLVTQLLFCVSNTSVSFLNPVFLQSTLFLCIGLVIFWIFIYKELPVNEFISLFIEDKEKDIKDIK